jgi:hypothetical protein
MQATTHYFMQQGDEVSEDLHRRDLIHCKMCLLERFAELVGVVGRARKRVEFVIEACKSNDVQRSCGKCREDVNIICSTWIRRRR